MNELTRSTGTALIPHNLNEAMALADRMCRAKLVPEALQNSPGDCLLVIEQAMRWGMSPFAVAQEVSVIHKRIMYSGKIVAAAIQSAPGVLVGRLSYKYEGEGNDRKVIVSGTLRGESESRSVEVLLKNARTDNLQWIKQPDQQLAYHGARVWGRRYVPEVMLGVYAPEEFGGTTIEGHAESSASVPEGRQLRPAITEQISRAEHIIEHGQPRDTERHLGGDGLPDALSGHDSLADKVHAAVRQFSIANSMERVTRLEQHARNGLMQDIERADRGDLKMMLVQAMVRATDRFAPAPVQTPADNDDPFGLPPVAEGVVS